MTRIIYYFSTLLLLLSWSCTDVQDFKKDATEYAENKWIESTMRKEYYWYKDIPEASKLNYNLGAEDFFNLLLSDKDGKIRSGIHYPYSKIETKSDATTKASDNQRSPGFEVQAYNIINLNRHALRVLYMLPNSPATGKDIKRGDWIYEINNQNITNELVKLLNSGAEVKLGISETLNPKITKTVTLSATIVEDNPVYLHKVFDIKGKNIAYLVYNHFTAGSGGNDETFNKSMRKAFTELKEFNPDELILDLRYNGGGLVSCAQLLSTMLAPASALDDIFCKMTYNDKKTIPEVWRLDTRLINQGTGGKNLDLKRLFVITSRNTASASEAVINGLKPYLGEQLIVVGEQTEGKNVGSFTYKDKRYNSELHPIVGLVSNKNDESDYADGFIPDMKCSEPNDGLLDFGDPKEYILSRVLAFIETGTPIEAQTVRSIDTNNMNIIPLGSSLDRKKTNGVVIDIER